MKVSRRTSTVYGFKLNELQLSNVSQDTGPDSDQSFDSEKSYETLFSKTEVYETVAYLIFNLIWLFTAALASVILFVIFTYDITIDPTFYHQTVTIVVVVACDAIIVVDTVAAIIHFKWKKYSSYRELTPRSRFLILIDCISIVWMITEFFPKLRDFVVINCLTLMFLLFRLYRPVWFFYVVSEKPGLNTIGILLKKYGVVLFLFTHASACILEGISKKVEMGHDTWATIATEIYHFNESDPLQWYIIAMYFSLGTVCFEGFGDLYAQTDTERIFLCMQMIIAFFLVTSTFLGAWTTVQVDVYTRHSHFMNRLNLIKRCLNHKNVSAMLRQLLISHYLTFWNELKAVQYSDLFDRLPEGLRQRIYFDNYWNAFQETYLLKGLHPAFLRAVAATMTTEIYTKNEVIYVQGDAKDSMIFVQRGTIQILSSEDGESPILSLGVGTCLGETNLIYSYESPVTIRASTYVVVQRLQKKDMWRVAYKYRRLNEIKEIHARMKHKFESAVENYKIASSKRLFEPPMKSIKKRLGDEAEEKKFVYNLSVFVTKLKEADEIFLKTKFPWILQPTSQFLNVWEHIVCVSALIAAIWYPYGFSFIRAFSPKSQMMTAIVDWIFMLDLLFQAFTAVETKEGLVTSVPEILSERKTHFSFILDVLSVLPLRIFSYCLTINIERLSSVLMMNRLLKLYRVTKFLSKYGVTLSTHFTFIRCLRYVVYLVLISYFMGSLFYLIACYEEECLENSWFTKVKQDDEKLGMIRHKYPFEISFFYGTSVLTQQGAAGVVPRSIFELIVVMISFIISLLVFCYLVADYSATVMLAEQSREDFVELAYVVRKYLSSNNISKGVQYRTDNYLSLQWYYNKAYNLIMRRSVLYDAPKHLYDAFQASMWHEYLLAVPLFQNADHQALQMIVSSKEVMLLPPNDVIICSGNIVKHMYIIESGFCELISSVSGKTEKVLGPLSSFCHFEMLLDRPGIYTIRTLTHARLLKFSCQTIKKALTKYDKKLDDLITELKTTPTVQRLFAKTDVKNYEIVEESTASWFVFSRRKTSAGYHEYENGFRNMKFWAFTKPFFLRRTIIPNGDFIVFWELAQAVRIFFMCIAANFVPLLSIYNPSAVIINIVLDVFTVLDMYVRIHLCYYNSKGILVTHPRYTAHNYITTSFPVDLLTILPLPNIYNLMIEREYQLYHVQYLMTLHKLLQIYRIPGAFYYFERDALRPALVTLNIAKVCLLTVILLNALTVIMVVVTCEVKQDADGKLSLTPYKYSWLQYAKDNFNYDITEPINLYITELYFILNSVLLIQFGDVLPHTPKEIYCYTFLVIAGYLLLTYILVEVTSCRVNVSGSLTTYQQNMHHLISYMKKEHISRALQRKTIDYYEYIWKRRHGLDTSDILNKYHFALKQDVVLDLYEEIFEAVPVFADVGRSFYSTLGMQVAEEYYLHNFYIIRLNDIVNTFYIIQKGTVKVIAPDGTIFTTLSPGCVFGHIDNTRSSRSMVSVVSNTKVDVLTIRTEQIYSILNDYPAIAKKLERHILLENLSYIDNDSALLRKRAEENQNLNVEIGEKDDDNEKVKHEIISKKNIVLKFTSPLTNMITSLLSCIIIPYHLAFHPYSYYMLASTYVFDLIHGIYLYNKMSDKGNASGSKWYDKFSNHKTEVFGLLPFDILALTAPRPTMLYRLTWCRLNRMIRMLNIFKYYQVVLALLNIQVSLTALSEACIFLFLTAHIGACILYLMACPGNICRKDSWIYNKDGKLLCGDAYICSFYFINNIITFTAFGDLTPNNVMEVIVYMVLALLAKFITTILIANISAVIQNNAKNLSAFDYDLATLKQHMENNLITPSLVHQTIVYVNQLWDRDQGVQLPVLLGEAPNCLIEEIKIEAYGAHIFNSFLFGTCHKDLLRLIISKLQVQTYFRGDVICHQGAVNQNMYFIHRGSVSSHESNGTEQYLIQHLKEFDAFGTLQGLLCAVPHCYTFKAETACVILTLHLLDWIEFLRFYRAAKSEIYDRIYRL